MPQISDLSLKISYWFVSHRQQFRRWWFVGLVAATFLLVVYVAVVLTLYVAGSDRIAKTITATPRTVLSASFKSSHRPVELSLSTLAVMARGDGRVDLAVRVKNDNVGWAAVMHYVYQYQAEPIASGLTYVGPATTGYLLGFNAALPETVSSEAVTLVLERVEWILVSSRPDAVTPSFLVRETGRASTSEGGQPATVVTATILNQAVVGWREVPVAVVITSGDQIVGVNQFIVRTWESLAERVITVQWRRAFPPAVQVNIIPVVNPFDPATIIRSARGV